MRIDLPLCNLKSCRYCFDGNCTKKSEHECCEYRMFSELREVLGNNYDLEYLKCLIKADQECRCVALPCKLGDPVYEILSDKKGTHFRCWVCRVVGIHYVEEDRRYARPKSKNYLIVRSLSSNYAHHIDMNKIGKTVFFNEVDAELAIQKMKEKQNERN